MKSPDRVKTTWKDLQDGLRPPTRTCIPTSVPAFWSAARATARPRSQDSPRPRLVPKPNSHHFCLVVWRARQVRTSVRAKWKSPKTKPYEAETCRRCRLFLTLRNRIASHRTTSRRPSSVPCVSLVDAQSCALHTIHSSTRIYCASTISPCCIAMLAPPKLSA